MNIDLKKLHVRLSRPKRFIIALLALSFIWPLQFISKLNFYPELTSVDVSWMLALSNAWDQQLIWGEDIIFTYGPLSFLSTRVITNSSVWTLAIFDIYVACSFVFIIYKVITQQFSWRKSLLILIACFFYKQAMLLSLVFTLQLIAILYLNQYKHERKYIYIVQAIVLSTLIFYIKLNLAFVCILIFLLYIIYLKSFKDISWIVVVISIFALALTIQVSSLLLPINLGNYISTGISLIASYGDAVYIYPRTLLEKGLAGIILALFILGVFCILKELKNQTSTKKIIGLIFILLFFVVFKQSYIRADLEHIKDFFYCTPPCLLVFMYVSNARLQYIHLPFVLAWIITIGLLFRFQDYFYPIKKVVAFPAYIYSIINQPDYYTQAKNRAIPEKIKQKIGARTVDIIPWESSLIILNKLHYAPRPIIQSYQAYNGRLDQINADRYSGTKAPNFVLYSINSIDQHYHFFDDAFLKETLYKNYTIIDSFICFNERILLFERNNRMRKYEFIKVASGVMNNTDIFLVPQSNYPLMAKIKMNYSWLGDLQKFVLRAPNSKIKMTLEDSASMVFRTGTSVLEAGVFMNPYIENEKDLLDFFNKTGESTKKTKQFQMIVDNSACWESTIEYEWYELR